MDISQTKEKITLKIINKEDLDKISRMKLDLLLPQNQQKKSQQKKRQHCKVCKTEPLLVYELPAKVQKIIPIKEATVKVNSVTATLIRTKKNDPCDLKKPRL